MIFRIFCLVIFSYLCYNFEKIINNSMFQRIKENQESENLSNPVEKPDDFLDTKKSMMETKKKLLEDKIVVESSNKYFKLEGFDSRELDLEKKKCLVKLNELTDISQETVEVANDIITKKIPIYGANYKLAEIFFYRGEKPEKFAKVFHYLDDDKKQATPTRLKFTFIKNKISDERLNVMMDYFNKLFYEIEKIDDKKANEFRKQNLEELKKEYTSFQEEMMLEFGKYLMDPSNILADRAIK